MAQDANAVLDEATERLVAKALFNRVWTLLDTAARTDEQNVELVHAAHASAYHWMNAGTAVNRVRSEWQCSRVYAVIGRAEPALWHARKALEICEREDIGDFDFAFSYEALARSHALAGEHDEAVRWADKARIVAADLAEEDRELLLADLATIARHSNR